MSLSPHNQNRVTRSSFYGDHHPTVSMHWRNKKLTATREISPDKWLLRKEDHNLYLYCNFNRVIKSAHSTGRPRTYHKTIISLFPGVHRKTELNVFSWWRKVLVDNSNSPQNELIHYNNHTSCMICAVHWLQIVSSEAFHKGRLQNM